MSILPDIIASRRTSAPSGKAEVATLSSAAVYGPTTPVVETQGARVGTLAGAAVYGPTTPVVDTQGVRVGTFAACVVIGPI